MLSASLEGPSPAKALNKEGEVEKKEEEKPKSLFGQPFTSGGSLFGSTTSTSGSLFGASGFKFPSTTSTTNSVFGGSLFGSSTTGGA